MNPNHLRILSEVTCNSPYTTLTKSQALAALEMLQGEMEKYLKHLPTCNLKKDWSEVVQALAETPIKYQDESYDDECVRLQQLRNTCTCGLDQLKNK